MNEEDSHEQSQFGDLEAGDSGSATSTDDDSESESAPVESAEQTQPESGPSQPDAVEETVELGVALLSNLETDECSLADAIDRIETVTTDPALTREILDTAELRGIIEREEGILRVNSGSFVRFERDVVRREGDFTCRRCGATLSTGHFVQFDAGEHGPFGSSCIKKVLNRE